MLAARDASLLEAKRAADDLKANVGILHVRLEHAQAGLAQVSGWPKGGGCVQEMGCGFLCTLCVETAGWKSQYVESAKDTMII